MPASEAPLAEFSNDMTNLASQHQLSPVVGREAEQQRMIQVLGRTVKRNPVLVGERGAGKRSIVSALAQRVAEGDAPSFLAGKRIVELDLVRMVSTRRAAAMDFASHATAELLSSADTIYFVPELYSLLLNPPERSWLSAVELLKNALLEGKLQCITTASAEENSQVNERHSWIARCFTEISVSPPTEAEAIRILAAVKERFEKHHQVTYTEDAIRYAVIYAGFFIKNRALPDKALDLLDEAGSYVRSQVAALPDEVVALRKKIRFIVKRMEDDIANHEFAKARFHSDEERSERENLRALESRLGLDTTTAIPVTREIIEEVLASWTGLSVETIRASRLKASEGN
jgi:ATP-dependent Clp protease ATP-binding subunit ClpC